MRAKHRNHESENEEQNHHKEEKGIEPPKEDESNWLVSYADMMTLLCGFFIMLFSMSKLDEPKYDSFKENLAKQFGGEYKSPTKEMAAYISKVIQDLGIQSSATVKADPFGVSISFESTFFFDTLSSNISQDGTKSLDKIITSILERQKNTQKNYRIVVEGHTDGRPILSGLYPSNWELSGARASRVIRMFLSRGFSPNYLTAIGYADTHPQVEARLSDGQWDEKALAKNRRVVLRVLEPTVESIPFPDVPEQNKPKTDLAEPQTPQNVSKN